MQPEEILKVLEYDDRQFPRDALVAAIGNPTAVIPGLIGFIRYAREHAEAAAEPGAKLYIGHLYAMFLLAQSRAHEACATIADFFGSLPEQTLNDLTGDLVTEQLDRILASVSCGDDSFIRGLVENEEAFSWVRAAALQSLVIMVAAGLKTREEVIGYFGGLFKGGLRREPSPVWCQLVAGTSDLNPGDLFDEIERADNERLFDTEYISMGEIAEEKARSVAESLERLPGKQGNSLITDAIGDLEKWSNAMRLRDLSGKLDINDIAGFNLGEILSHKVPGRAAPRPGRNSPCPCGSGKKYKQCCGAAK
jgi:hypothetical protein